MRLKFLIGEKSLVKESKIVVTELYSGRNYNDSTGIAIENVAPTGHKG